MLHLAVRLEHAHRGCLEHHVAAEVHASSSALLAAHVARGPLEEAQVRAVAAQRLVQRKGIARADVGARRVLAQHARRRRTAREALQRALQHRGRQARVLGKLCVREARGARRAVKRKEHGRLEGIHVQLLDACAAEVRAQDERAERVLPLQRAPRVPDRIERRKAHERVLQRRRQRDVRRGAGDGPVCLCQHAHVERARRVLSGKGRRQLVRRVHVAQHRVEVRRVVRPALVPQLRQHGVFRGGRGGRALEEPLCEAALEARGKDVLVVHEAEQRKCLGRRVWRAAERRVDVRREALGDRAARVHAVFERRAQRMVQRLVAVEAGRPCAAQRGVDRKQALDGVCVRARRGERVCGVCAHGAAQRVERADRGEQGVESVERGWRLGRPRRRRGARGEERRRGGGERRSVLR